MTKKRKTKLSKVMSKVAKGKRLTQQDREILSRCLDRRRRSRYGKKYDYRY